MADKTKIVPVVPFGGIREPVSNTQVSSQPFYNLGPLKDKLIPAGDRAQAVGDAALDTLVMPGAAALIGGAANVGLPEGVHGLNKKVIRPLYGAAQGSRNARVFRALDRMDSPQQLRDLYSRNPLKKVRAWRTAQLALNKPTLIQRAGAALSRASGRASDFLRRSPSGAVLDEATKLYGKSVKTNRRLIPGSKAVERLLGRGLKTKGGGIAAALTALTASAPFFFRHLTKRLQTLDDGRPRVQDLTGFKTP